MEPDVSWCYFRHSDSIFSAINRERISKNPISFSIFGTLHACAVDHSLSSCCGFVKAPALVEFIQTQGDASFYRSLKAIHLLLSTERGELLELGKLNDHYNISDSCIFT
jgi:hypothetical protein